MITPYEKQLKILLCTSNGAKKMGPTEAFGLFQDIATEHSQYMNADFDTMREQSNTFWAITKTRIHFEREPEFFEDVTVRSWPNAPSSLTGNRNYVVIGKDGQAAIEAVTEWVLLDMTTRRPRRFSSTCYPVDQKHMPDTLFDTPFHRIQYSLDELEYAYSHIVRSSDTDIAGHTNNTVYCRLMLDAFPASFFRENSITDFEVRYAVESKEGDELRIYKRECNKSYHLAVVNSDNKIIVTALLNIA